MTYTNGQLRDWQADRGYVDEITAALRPTERNRKTPDGAGSGDAKVEGGIGSRSGLGHRRSPKSDGLRSDVRNSESNYHTSHALIYAGWMALAFSIGAWSCVTALKVMAAL